MQTFNVLQEQCQPGCPLDISLCSIDNIPVIFIYRMFSAQADWNLTHTSHKDAEQSTIEASITLDGVTLTDSLLT
jgi:hypothetical protein